MMDIERLKVDADYWLDKDPSNGESTHYEAIYDGHECAWVRVDRKGQRHYWLQGGWVNAEIYADEIGPVESMIPRPTKTERSEDVSTEWVDGLPEYGSKWEHYSGRVYRVIMIANANTERPGQYPVTVIYENVNNGTVWSRPASEWGRSFRPYLSPEQREREELTKVILDAVDKKEFASMEWAEHARRVIDQSVDAILQWMKDKEK